MKSPKAGFLTFGFLAALAVSAAAEMPGVCTGQVISIDTSRQELSIREEGSQKMRTFKVLNADVLRTLKNGDTVQVSAADEKKA